MKKLVSLVLVLCLTFGLAAAVCAEEKITVAGIVFKDEFTMKMVQQGYQDAARDLGVEVLIGNSMGDISNEQMLIQSYMDLGVKGIAITPYSEEASTPMLKEAYDRGVEIAVANIKLNDAPFICGGFTSQDYLNGQSLGKFMAPIFEERFGSGLTFRASEDAEFLRSFDEISSAVRRWQTRGSDCRAFSPDGFGFYVIYYSARSLIQRFLFFDPDISGAAV